MGTQPPKGHACLQWRQNHQAEPLPKRASPIEQGGLGVLGRKRGCGLGQRLLPCHSEMLGGPGPGGARCVAHGGGGTQTPAWKVTALQCGDEHDDRHGLPGPGSMSSPGLHTWEGSLGLPQAEPRGSCLLPGPRC